MRCFAKLLVAVLCLWVTPALATGPMASPGPLASPSEVHDMDAVLLDLRSVKAFDQGHLPGAISVPYGNFPWRVSRYGRPALLPHPQDLAVRLGKLGITRMTRLVVIDNDLGTAAVVFWTLKSLGHTSAHILDGGPKAWTAAGFLLSTKAAVNRPVKRYGAIPDLTVVADEAYVVNYRDNAMVPLDCRTEIYWGGEKGGAAQDDFGSIEDSLNMSYEWITNSETGWYRPLEEISALYRRKMASMLPHFLKHRVMSMPTVFFGYDGRQAAICWFAVYALIGNKEARIYDGGMVDWEKTGHTIWNLQDGMGAR